jgi:hypothetical protein
VPRGAGLMRRVVCAPSPGARGIRMDEIAGDDLVRIKPLRSSEIDQLSPDARKLPRSTAGPPRRQLR